MDQETFNKKMDELDRKNPRPIKNFYSAERIAAIAASAAAPQVVADERKGSPYPEYDRGFSNGWDACAKRAAAPVQPVAVPGGYAVLQSLHAALSKRCAEQDQYAREGMLKAINTVEREMMKYGKPSTPVAVPDDGLVPLSVDGKSVWLEGIGAVALDYSSVKSLSYIQDAAPAAQGDAISQQQIAEIIDSYTDQGTKETSIDDAAEAILAAIAAKAAS